MNEQQSFIIEDLDDFHLLIKADEEDRIRRQLETEVRRVLFLSYPRYADEIIAREEHIFPRLTPPYALKQ